MLRRLVEFSVRFRGVVITLAFLLIAYGLFVTAHARLDVFPEFAPPEVVIQTEAPGLSPLQVEQLVTRPIEDAVNGVGDLASLRSKSIQGLSKVTAVFRSGTDIYRARQFVGERLAALAAKMPRGVAPPTMAPLTSSTSVVLTVGLTSRKLSPMQLRTFADWTLRPRLLGVAGVSKAVIFGGEVRELQVQVIPQRLALYGLALSDVVAAARRATGIRGAGFVSTPGQRIVIRTRGQALTPGELGQVVLGRRNGIPIRLRDVARVVNAAEPKLGDASILGSPGVLLVVSSQYGANTLRVTAGLDQALRQMKTAFASEGITVYPALFRPASFIERAIHHIDNSLLIGGILVAIVLFLFLLNLRTALISFVSIPLSLLAAVVVLDRAGTSLNTITLGGFAIAIGVVVDDAIIDVENVWRRLRENRALARPRPLFPLVVDAVLEVRSPVVYATFVVALVFLPILTLSGVEGRLFSPLAISFILAILASLAVAVTVTPALCFWLLPGAKGSGEPGFVRRLKGAHRVLLEAAGRHPRLVLGVALALFLASLATLPFFGSNFLPDLHEGNFIVHMAAVPGTSIAESLRLGRKVTRALLQIPQIQSVAQTVGRAQEGDDTPGPNESEFEVALKPSAADQAEGVQAEVRRALSRFPGAGFSVNTFLSERIAETVSGEAGEVVIKIFGNDLDVLDQKARQVARVLSSVPGAVDVEVPSPPGVPQEVVRLLPRRLARFGFDPVDVLDAVHTAYAGSVVGQTYEGNRVFDVAVILDPGQRRDPQSVGALLLRSPQGLEAPLGELARVYETTGRSTILHDGTRRLQVVTCNVRGRNLSSFVAEARRKIAAEVSFPPGVFPVFTGAAEAAARAQTELLVNSAIAAVGIVLLLFIVLGNLRNLLLVLANLPFALIGGVLAVFAGGGSLTLGSLVGFVTLFGITTRNSILLVSHYEHLTAVEDMNWGLEAALRGAGERLVPILMTALVTALGLLPIALASGKAGGEIEGPMAIVILGGLFTSTLLNLLVLPTLALRYGRFGSPPPRELPQQPGA